MRRAQPPVLRSGKLATSVLALDLDDTLTPSAKYDAEFYFPALFELTDPLELDRNEVVRVHHIHEQKKVHSIEYLITELVARAAHARGQKPTISDTDLLPIQLKFNDLRFSEQFESFPNVAETLAEIRRCYPGIVIIVITLCRDWHAPLRLGKLLQYIDGIVAVQPEPPLVSLEYFPRCVSATSLRLEKLYAQEEELCEHLILDLSLPAAQSKPEKYGPQFVQGWARVPAERVVFVGNSMVDKQCALNAGWPNFVVANYGANPAELASGELSGKYHIDLFPELLPILKQLNSN
jgi:phosphoglycolate phosphatase-like HAD superfamily hydrolase